MAAAAEAAEAAEAEASSEAGLAAGKGPRPWRISKGLGCNSRKLAASPGKGSEDSARSWAPSWSQTSAMILHHTE